MNDIFACLTPHAVFCNATHYIHVELNVSFKPVSYQTRKSFRKLCNQLQTQAEYYLLILSAGSFKLLFEFIFCFIFKCILSSCTYSLLFKYFAWCYVDVECFSTFRSRYRSFSTFFPSFLLFRISYSFIFRSSFYLSYRWILPRIYVKRCNNMSNYLPLIETWCNVCFKFFVHQTVSCHLIV